MEYDEEFSEDRRHHQKYHDEVVSGLPSRRLKSDRVLWESGSARLLLVRHKEASLKDRRRAEQVAMLARLDTPFGHAAYHAGELDEGRDAHMLLLEVDQRLIGLVLADRRDHCQQIIWKEWGGLADDPLRQDDPIWCICMVWIHRKHRRRGFAASLVRYAAEYLRTDLNSIGWYQPFTDSGRALAQKLCPESFLAAD